MEQNWESWNNPYTLGQMIFDKVSRSFSVERMVFLTEGGGRGELEDWDWQDIQY